MKTDTIFFRDKAKKSELLDKLAKIQSYLP